MRKLVSSVRACARRPLLLACVLIGLIALVLFILNPDSADKSRAEDAQEASEIEYTSELRHWTVQELVADLKNEDPFYHVRAVHELHTLGPGAEPAIPALVEALGDGSAQDVGDVAGQTLAGLGPCALRPLIDALKHHSNPKVRAEAARALGRMEGQAAPAIPALQAALADDATRVPAAYALWLIDPESKLVLPTLFSNPQMPADNLVAALESTNPKVSRLAARALGAMGPDAKEAVPALVKALRQPTLRTTAALALRSLARSLDVNAAKPLLVEMLKDRDAAVRRAAAQALAQIAGKDGSLAPALSGALEDTEKEVVQNALSALYDMGPAAEPALPGLIRLLHGQEHAAHAAYVLEAIGPAARPALPDLLALSEARTNASNGFAHVDAALGAIGAIGPTEEVLPTLLRIRKDEQLPSRRDRIAQIIGHLGPAARNAIPVLARDLEPGSTADKEPAAEALAQIGPDSIPALIHALDLPHGPGTICIAKALASFGPKAKEAVPGLQNALHDPYHKLVLQASVALYAIAPDLPEARTAILDALRTAPIVPSGRPSYYEDVRSDVTPQIEKMAPTLAPLLPQLIGMIQKTDPEQALRVLGVIAKMGPAGKPALPALKDLTHSGDARIRQAAAVAMIDVGADAADTIPVLREQIREPDSFDRPLLVWELSRFGTAARPAIPELVQVLQLPDCHARLEALRTLAALGSPVPEAIPALTKLATNPMDSECSWSQSSVSLAREQAWRLGIQTTPAETFFPQSEDREFVTPHRQGSHDIAEQAMHLLIAWDSTAKPATPALLAALEDERLPVRRAAFAALRAIDVKSAEAVRLSPEKVAMAWKELNNNDAEKAYDAAWTLIVHPGSTLPWLRDRLLSQAPSERPGLQRSISVLERMATPPARDLLTVVAKRSDDPLAPLAEAALNRLAKK